MRYRWLVVIGCLVAALTLAPEQTTAQAGVECFSCGQSGGDPNPPCGGFDCIGAPSGAENCQEICEGCLQSGECSEPEFARALEVDPDGSVYLAGLTLAFDARRPTDEDATLCGDIVLRRLRPPSEVAELQDLAISMRL